MLKRHIGRLTPLLDKFFNCKENMKMTTTYLSECDIQQKIVSAIFGIIRYLIVIIYFSYCIFIMLC